MTGLEDLPPHLKKILRESFLEAFGVKGSAKREEACEEVACDIGRLLQQEYRKHQGQWWLWSLGKPVRPLTEQEIRISMGCHHSD